MTSIAPKFLEIQAKGGFTLCNAVASNEPIEKGQGRTMLLATWLHATPCTTDLYAHISPCLPVHTATLLQRRYIDLSPAHRVAPLLQSNGSVASVGERFGNQFMQDADSFCLSKNYFHPVKKKSSHYNGIS